MYRKALLAFVVISFGVSWLVDLVPRLVGLKGGTWTETIVLLAGTWGPALGAAISTRFVLKQAVLGEVGIRRFKWSGELTSVALLGPPVAAFLTTWVAAVLGAGDWKSPLGGTPPLQLAWVLLLTGTVGVLFNVPGALGEEIGWRGFLFPCLTRAGVRWPLLVGGVLWGVWHFPLLAVRPKVPGHPILGALLVPVATTLLNVSLVRLRQITGAIWLSMIVHAAINSWGSLPRMMLIDHDPLVASMTGIGGWLPLAGLAILLTAMFRQKVDAKVPAGAHRR